MAQVVECLLCKCNTLSSKLRPTKRRKFSSVKQDAFLYGRYNYDLPDKCIISYIMHLSWVLVTSSSLWDVSFYLWAEAIKIPRFSYTAATTHFPDMPGGIVTRRRRNVQVTGLRMNEKEVFVMLHH
jgi:hypothetical protein